MAQFVTGSFNTMDPRLLSPVQQALNDYGQIQQNMIAHQKAKQAQIQTGFLNPQLQALLEQEQQKAKQAAITTQYQPLQESVTAVSKATPAASLLAAHPLKAAALTLYLQQHTSDPLARKMLSFFGGETASKAPANNGLPAGSVPVSGHPGVYQDPATGKYFKWSAT